MKRLARLVLMSLCVVGLYVPVWAAGNQVTATCVLKWVKPTQNTDGSPLTDLDSYQIFRSTTSGQYSATPAGTATAADTSKPCASFGANALGQYYVVMKSVNSKGKVGAASLEVPFEIIPEPIPNPPSAPQVIEFTGAISGTLTLQGAPK